MTANEKDPSESSGPTPDIVGDIATVANTSLMTILFGRAATAAGNFYGEKVEDYFKQKKKEAQRKNLEDHATRVVEVTGKPLNAKPTQYIKIERWVLIAADVPKEDVERSALFEAVLAEITSTDGTSEYQEVAEKLTSNATRLLLNAPTDDGIAPTSDDQRGFEGLKSLGLARTLSLRQVLALTGAWFVGTFVGLVALLNVLPRYFPKLLAIEFIAETVAVSLVLMLFALAAISTNYRLTELGASLQKSARRFYQAQKRLPRVSVLSVLPNRAWVWGLSAALLACLLPPLLELYLPAFLRTTGRPTVVISSPPVSPPIGSATPSVSGPSPPPPTNQVTLSSEEIGRLVEFWNSIKDQMDSISDFSAQGRPLVETWPQEIEKNRDGFASRLSGMSNLLNLRRGSLAGLMSAYRKYPNVQTILNEINANEGVIGDLYSALNRFADETRLVQLPPKNFEGRLKPYANGLLTALGAMTKWANATADFAALQSGELSKVEVK
jgi:hypothetical protein